MAEVVLWVKGTPAPQGSKTLMRGRLIESSKRVRPWRDAIVQAVRENGHRVLFGEHVPVEVTVMFLLARPRTHYGTGRMAAALRGDAPRYPTAKQRDDTDKLCRSTLDGLAEAGVLDDDSQVVTLTARKRYAGHGQDPGARIRISTLRTTG